LLSPGSADLTRKLLPKACKHQSQQMVLIGTLLQIIMADLDVQPKKTSSWWIWLLLGIIMLAVLFFFMRDRDGLSDTRNIADSAELATSRATSVSASGDWSGIDPFAPQTRYEEITSPDVSVRGNNQYAIYSLDETILFDSDKSAIRQEAADDLSQIAASAEKRFKAGEYRVYGYTDARGSAATNKQLAQERAEAVKNWLIKTAHVAADRVTVNAVGESRPVASNSSEAGRRQNRRVEIVVRRK
jgi:outer membrane protein OmpA-like peptidoglycan-associated protein